MLGNLAKEQIMNMSKARWIASGILVVALIVGVASFFSNYKAPADPVLALGKRVDQTDTKVASNTTSIKALEKLSINKVEFSTELMQRFRGVLDEMPKNVSLKTFDDYAKGVGAQIVDLQKGLAEERKVRLTADLVQTQPLPMPKPSSPAPQTSVSPEQSTAASAATDCSKESSEISKLSCQLSLQAAKHYNEVIGVQKTLGDKFGALDKKVNDNAELARKANEQLRRDIGTAEDGIRVFKKTFEDNTKKVDEKLEKQSKAIDETKALAAKAEATAKAVATVMAAAKEPPVQPATPAAEVDKQRWATYIANCSPPKRKLTRKELNDLPGEDYDQLLMECRGMLKSEDAPAAGSEKTQDESQHRVPVQVASSKGCPPGQVWEGYPIMECLYF